ncbi:DUF4158 domain-containing protein, partial [Escherichia coli]|nr:DUF4158 domain-containing protein [Escherichia coli]
MSRRHIFTERQRAALFDLPTDELSLLKFYTLGDDDLENIRQRRRPENRIGFALQLCALRYPGRALAGTVAKLAMRQPFVLFKGLTFQKLCLPGAFRPGDHHNKMLRPG